MKLGIIGCGKMGSALIDGALQGKVVQSSDLRAFDLHSPSLEAFAAQTGAQPASSNQEVIDESEVVLLCTKPQDLPALLASLEFARQPLLLSIAAGLALATLETSVGGDCPIIRVMPNTPALVGQGASAYALGTRATRQHAAMAQAIFGAVGIAHEVKEDLLDAVTGLSGSGPAYVYTLIETLADAGVQNGLPREIALDLALQTVLGAASMVKETGQHPAVLRDMVTSPGGTTIAGLAALEEKGLRAALLAGVKAATTRSQELGQ
ncbi:MAG: pyrroline-5-carboxylate reductase [Verrucomicrobiota bacterium]